MKFFLIQTEAEEVLDPPGDGAARAQSLVVNVVVVGPFEEKDCNGIAARQWWWGTSHHRVQRHEAHTWQKLIKTDLYCGNSSFCIPPKLVRFPLQLESLRAHDSPEAPFP
jgi:hypothetical protein